MIIKNLKKYFTFEVQVQSKAGFDISLILSCSWTRFHCGMCRCLQVLDDKNVRRRFRASNYQSTTRVKPFICTMPMRLDDGWNQIQFNLSDFTRRAYGTNYIETLRVQVTACCGHLCCLATAMPSSVATICLMRNVLLFQIHANCRIRRVYFSDRLYSEDELPAEFKLYLPIQQAKKWDCRASSCPLPVTCTPSLDFRVCYSTCSVFVLFEHLKINTRPSSSRYLLLFIILCCAVCGFFSQRFLDC